MGKPQNIGSKSHIQQTQQEMGNQSFDSLFDISVIEPLEYVPAGNATPATLVRPLAYTIATRLDDTTTANVTYVGRARIGENTAHAVWQIHKINQASGMIITWADGNAEFDNVWDNRASLTYA